MYLRRAVERLGHEIAQAALKQLDVPQHLGVDRNRQIVRRPREVRGDGLLGRERRGRRVASRFIQQLVDDRRFGPRFREPVALAQRDEVQRADAIEQAIELGGEPRVTLGPAGRGEQHVHGVIEMLTGGDQMPRLELGLASGEALFRLSDAVGD